MSTKDVSAPIAPTLLGKPMTGNDETGWTLRLVGTPLEGLPPSLGFEFGCYRALNGKFVAHMNANGHSQFKVCEGKTRRAALNALEREFEKLWLAMSLARTKLGLSVREAVSG